MIFHAMTERYEEITVCGKPALFTSIRIKRDTVPDGLYATMSGMTMSAGASLVRAHPLYIQNENAVFLFLWYV